jgi:hypothetical protein
MNKPCFVCEKSFNPKLLRLNSVVNLYVCTTCKGSKEEKAKENELLEGLADGFVCGCI